VAVEVAEAVPRLALRSPMQRREFRAMGSKMLVLMDTEKPPTMLAEAPDWFEGWEQALSRFRIDSELTQLNEAAGVPVVVSSIMWDAIATALEAEALTRGLVNPLILRSLELAGYDRPFDLLRSEPREDGAAYATIDTLARPPKDTLPDVRSIVVDAATRTICVPQGMGLDFGGVAKGWAAHQAMLKLRAAGPALFSAGGDVAVSGPLANGDAWEVRVEDPFNEGGFIETLYLEGGGVATSGKDHRHWWRGSVQQHHIIDPRTRQPARTDVTAATVIASTVMRAEAMAKAAVICGSDSGMAMVDAWPDVEALLVLDDGSMLYSKGIDEYL
jgi:thiamine biosynthesis lipoprotein